MTHFSIRRVTKEIEIFQNISFKIPYFFNNLKFEFFTENNKHYLMIYDKYLNLFTQLEITQTKMNVTVANR